MVMLTLFGSEDLVRLKATVLVTDIVITPVKPPVKQYIDPSNLIDIDPYDWSFLPVLALSHPNSPYLPFDLDTISLQYIGFVHTVSVEEGAIVCYLYIHAKYLSKISPAEGTKLRNGTPLELSIGGSFWIDETNPYKDEDGSSIDRVISIKPNHLALAIPAGACSVETHGCGAIQASMHPSDYQKQKGLEMTVTTSEEKPSPPYPDSVSQLLKHIGLYSSNLSDDERRAVLGSALYESIPAFDGVITVYPDYVIYSQSLQSKGGYAYYKLGYRFEDGTPIFDEIESAVRVTRSSEWVEVNVKGEVEASSQKPLDSECSCSKEGETLTIIADNSRSDISEIAPPEKVIEASKPDNDSLILRTALAARLPESIDTDGLSSKTLVSLVNYFNSTGPDKTRTDPLNLGVSGGDLKASKGNSIVSAAWSATAKTS